MSYLQPTNGQPYSFTTSSGSSGQLYYSAQPHECAECGALIGPNALGKHHIWHERLAHHRPIRYIQRSDLDE